MIYFNELAAVEHEDFKLGKYIYMGMGKCANHTVCISIGYKINYCLKKGMEFEKIDNSINFYKINKILIGKLQPCDYLLITEEIRKEYDDE